MKKLQKNERQRFEKVCSIIREALLIDHLERFYEFKTEKVNGGIASAYIHGYGARLKIYIYPEFWKSEYEAQLKHLIHEHIHVALHAFHQAADRITEQWVASHDKTQVDEIVRTGAEISIDLLTEALYRLMKNRFPA